MAKRAKWILTGALALWGSAAVATDIVLPRGTQEVFSDVSVLDSYALPVGPYGSGQIPTEPLEGQVHRRVFQLSNDSITLLQILAPLRAELEASGYDIRLDCAETACGGFDFRFATEVLPGPGMFVDLANYRFLAAQKKGSAIGVLASATDTKRFLQIIEVTETEAPDLAGTGVVAAAPAPSSDAFGDTSALGAMLERAGRMVLDDLSFETGSTALSEGPYGSLQALAGYLTSEPDARVSLVGHTDAVGALQGNIRLSQARAAAVRERLISSYDVSADQVSAQGVGYLSPRATNLTPEGRASNRRVEVVLTITE